jgi:hypothetical protein
MHTLGIIPAPLNDDLYVVEGIDEQRHIEWQAVISARDAETGTDVNSLPVATVLAAAGQMLSALFAIQMATSLEAVREIVDHAVMIATTPPVLPDPSELFEPLVF